MNQSNDKDGLRKFRSELECRFPEICDMSGILSKWMWEQFKERIKDRVLSCSEIIRCIRKYEGTRHKQTSPGYNIWIEGVAKSIHEAQKVRLKD